VTSSCGDFLKKGSTAINQESWKTLNIKQEAAAGIGQQSLRKIVKNSATKGMAVFKQVAGGGGRAPSAPPVIAHYNILVNGKGKSVPLQARRCPEGSKNLGSQIS